MDILAYLLGKKAGGGGSSVTVEALTATENKVYTAPSGRAYSPVTVNVPRGGVGVAASDVNFVDYDGSIVASYSAADFANLTEMPANPDRTSENKTAQGWNCTLADAKNYVAAYGKLSVGQMYSTTDGKTEVHIHLEQGRTSPMLGVCPNGTVDVDWGDGTTHDTLTGTSTSTVQWTPTHNYAAPGDYVIKLTVSEGGSMGLYGSSSSDEFSGLLRFSSSGDTRNKAYQNAIKALFIGSGVTSIGDNAFNNCCSLSSITLPSSVTSIGQRAFHGCYGLTYITVPNSITSIGKEAFYACDSLTSISLPSSLTRIASNILQNCYNLRRVTIQSGAETIGEEAYWGCTTLTSITIPNSITSIQSYAFYYCRCLTSITLPDSITSIGAYAFNGVGSLAELHFKSNTPPTVSDANAFSGLPTDCKIYVPTGRLSAYTSANNYPSSSTYTYVEE